MVLLFWHIAKIINYAEANSRPDFLSSLIAEVNLKASPPVTMVN